MFRTVLGLGSVLVATLICAPMVILLTSLRFVGLSKLSHFTQDFFRSVWLKFIMFACGGKVIVHGAENLDSSKSYFIASNHSSALDINTLGGYLPLPVRFIAKKSLFFIPLVGWAMYAAGEVGIDRGSIKKGLESFKKALIQLKERKFSILIFPEGTRSVDGVVKEFKAGSFYYPIISKIPVVPVAIKGAYKVLKKKSLNPTPGTIEVFICPPIETKDLDVSDRKELAQRVRKEIVEKLGQTV